MNTKSEIIAKIAALKAYSKSQEPETEALFTPLEEAASAYFDGDKGAVSAALEDVIKYMYNDISRRTTIFEHNFDMHLATNYPAGYYDITECFADFSEIMQISNADFYAAFEEGIDEDTGEECIVSNSYIDKWVEDLEEAATEDVNKVQYLAEWCKNSGGSCDVINLLENKGEIIEQLTKDEIVNQIYIETNMLNTIQSLGLTTYIPTYLRG